MKYILIIISVVALSCRKEFPQENVNGTKVANEGVVEGQPSLNPPLKLLMVPTESPLPVRPYMLVEYINVQRAYNNLPQSNSYVYRYTRTVQGKEGGVVKYTPPETITVDFDTYQTKPGMNLLKTLSCFQSISDLGATCSVELFTDLPVDGKPDIFFDWNSGSPGHSFIQLKKSNQGKSAVVNIGYYPVESWRLIFTTNPIAGKFVDDTQHEFNASVFMRLTPQELSSIISAIQAEAKIAKYDLDNYNCTDFAVKMFNTVRKTDPLIVPKYQLPKGSTPDGSSSPQGLYNAMFKRMRYSPMSKVKFTFPQTKAYAESTKVPCK